MKMSMEDFNHFSANYTYEIDMADNSVFFVMMVYCLNPKVPGVHYRATA